MPISQARVPTAEASRYLKQLCRHWSHKFPVEATDAAGTVPFGEDRVMHVPGRGRCFVDACRDS